MRRTLVWILPLLATLSGSAGEGRRAETEGLEAAAEPAAPPVLFVERAEALGVRFTHVNGRSGRFYMPEINGAGCAVLDYDDDGDLDVFLLQGHALGAQVTPEAIRAAGGDRLLRNDLRRDAATGAADAASLRFTDVTTEAGLASHGYSFGVATGDVDNDGDVDLLVTRFGAVQLWRNQGDGTFADATAASGVEDRRWNVAAAFLDYDRDGWLDLYLGTYVDFTFEGHKTCRTAAGAQDYCGPSAYAGVTDRLLRNRGDGTFEDRSVQSGVGTLAGKSLGVVTGDFDADGWIDLYVANDQEPNFLWINRRDGTFSEEALLAGVAVDLHGHPQASMGVDAADIDDDGDEDLFMTHLATETDTFYRNDGAGMFEDATARTGLGPPGLRYTSWGTRWFDYDNDGRLDLFVANGGVRVIPELAKQGDAFRFDEPNQLFHGLGDGRYDDVSRVAGGAFELSEVSRGAAFGDLDDDGDTDIVVTNNDGPARVLINVVGQDAPWLGLRLLGGAAAPRDMLGAWVTLRRRGDVPLHRRVRTDGSFGSAHDPRVLFGLGGARAVEDGGDAVESVRVRWPDGSVEEWVDVAPGRYTTLRQGTGRRVE
jgi:enediyne biosynthesis protein E4